MSAARPIPLPAASPQWLRARAADAHRTLPGLRRRSPLSRDRLRLQAADRACVVLRISIHLPHLHRSLAAFKESMGFFADVQKVFAGDANA